MGPPPRSRTHTPRQAPWKQRRRPRLCLLKGCEDPFLPPHPSSRYCGEDCKAEARIWSQRKSSASYRSSKKGKEKRRAQSSRRRERLAAAATTASATDFSPLEGQRYGVGAKVFSCDRPGCYDLFEVVARSPHQRFCSASCRQALRRVRLREARWFAAHDRSRVERL